VWSGPTWRADLNVDMVKMSVEKES
jgi:hypothetical protein